MEIGEKSMSRQRQQISVAIERTALARGLGFWMVRGPLSIAGSAHVASAFGASYFTDYLQLQIGPNALLPLQLQLPLFFPLSKHAAP